MAPHHKNIAKPDAFLTAKHYYAYKVAWDRFTAEGGYCGTLRSVYLPTVLNHVKMDPFLFPHLNMHYSTHTFTQGLRVPAAADIAQAVENEFRREKGISLSLDAARDAGQKASLFCQTAKTKIKEAIQNKVWIVNRVIETEQPSTQAGPSQPYSSPYSPSSDLQEESKGYPFSAVKSLMHAEGYEKVTRKYMAKASQEPEIRAYQIQWQRQRGLEDRVQ